MVLKLKELHPIILTFVVLMDNRRQFWNENEFRPSEKRQKTVIVINLLRFEEIGEVILLLLAPMIWCKQDQCLQGFFFPMGQRLKGGYIEESIIESVESGVVCVLSHCGAKPSLYRGVLIFSQNSTGKTRVCY